MRPRGGQGTATTAQTPAPGRLRPLPERGRTKWMGIALLLLAAVAVPRPARAHCDTLDGPVVAAVTGGHAGAPAAAETGAAGHEHH